MCSNGDGGGYGGEENEAVDRVGGGGVGTRSVVEKKHRLLKQNNKQFHHYEFFSLTKYTAGMS